MDKIYWENFYKKSGFDSNINNQSTFASFCLKKYLNGKNLRIVELGSGNGRDAIFFTENGNDVIAVEQADSGIGVIRGKENREIKLKLVTDNFLTHDYSLYKPVNVFYSRFTLHAITSEEEDIMLRAVSDNLTENGLLCIEARTINDPLYGQGEKVDVNTFKTDHCRRFIDTKEFLDKILKMKFSLLYFNEGNNMSIYKDDNPVLMRIILKKIK
jgi:tellurite methyltransferase